MAIYTKTSLTGSFFEMVEDGTEQRTLPYGRVVTVKKRSPVLVTNPAKIAQLTSVYESVMNNEAADFLISFDVVEENGSFRGLANFRTIREHKQKRF